MKRFYNSTMRYFKPHLLSLISIFYFLLFEIKSSYLTLFLHFRPQLTHQFPRLIFPTFPRKINPDILGRYNNRTSLAVIIACKFIRAYLLGMKSNLMVSQSEIVLRFIMLASPITAVDANSINYLTALLQSKIDLNQHNESGFTALHRAVELGNVEIVKWLVGCSVVFINSKDNQGNTPLFLSTKLNNYDLFSILMENGADYKIKNNTRMTALHLAAKIGNISMCEDLIEKGIKVNELNEKKKSPLFYAISFKHPDVARLLLQRGAEPQFVDSHGNSLLHIAVQSGCIEIVETITKLDVIDINSHGLYYATPLHIAAAANYPEIAIALLKLKADLYAVDCNHHTPPYLAVLKGCVSSFSENFPPRFIH